MQVVTISVPLQEILLRHQAILVNLKNLKVKGKITGLINNFFVMKIDFLLKTLGVSDIPSLLSINYKENHFHVATRLASYTIKKEIIHEIAQQHFKTKGPILEVGNELPKVENQSYLKSLFPSDLQKDIISDGKINQYKQPETIKLEASKDSIAYVISCCFMDVLNAANLEKFLTEIKKVIVDDGLIVHFADLDPYVNTFYHAYVNEKRLIVPLTEGNSNTIIGLQWIEQEAYDKHLRKDLVDRRCDLTVQFLDWCCKLNQLQREMMVNLLGEYEIAGSISEWFKSKIPEAHLKTVLRSAYFENNLRETVVKAGFEIVEMGYRQKEVLSPNRTEEIQKSGGNVVSNLGKPISIDNTLDKDTLKTITKVHVLVAKKKPPEKDKDM